MEEQNGKTHTALDAAATRYSQDDVDIDIPIDDGAKEAIRWLLAQAFVTGAKHGEAVLRDGLEQAALDLHTTHCDGENHHIKCDRAHKALGSATSQS